MFLLASKEKRFPSQYNDLRHINLLWSWPCFDSKSRARFETRPGMRKQSPNQSSTTAGLWPQF